MFNTLKERKWIILLTYMMLAFILYHLSIDELYSKQIPFFGIQFEYLKILLLSIFSFAFAHYFSKRLKAYNKFQSISSSKLTIYLFLFLSSYLIILYGSRIVSHRLVNHEIRERISAKTINLPYAGKGFESIHLSYEEYNIIAKYNQLIELPKEAANIYVLDWSENDYRRIVAFDVPKDFNLSKYYQRDSLLLNKIKEIQLNDYIERESMQFSSTKRSNTESSNLKRYAYEISG